MQAGAEHRRTRPRPRPPATSSSNKGRRPPDPPPGARPACTERQPRTRAGAQANPARRPTGTLAPGGAWRRYPSPNHASIGSDDTPTDDTNSGISRTPSPCPACHALRPRTFATLNSRGRDRNLLSGSDRFMNMPPVRSPSRQPSSTDTGCYGKRRSEWRGNQTFGAEGRGRSPMVSTRPGHIERLPSG